MKVLGGWQRGTGVQRVGLGPPGEGLTSTPCRSQAPLGNGEGLSYPDSTTELEPLSLEVSHRLSQIRGLTGPLCTKGVGIRPSGVRASPPELVFSLRPAHPCGSSDRAAQPAVPGPSQAGLCLCPLWEDHETAEVGRGRQSWLCISQVTEGALLPCPAPSEKGSKDGGRDQAGLVLPTQALVQQGPGAPARGL